MMPKKNMKDEATTPHSRRKAIPAGNWLLLRCTDAQWALVDQPRAIPAFLLQHVSFIGSYIDDVWYRTPDSSEISTPQGFVRNAKIVLSSLPVLTPVYDEAKQIVAYEHKGVTWVDEKGLLAVPTIPKDLQDPLEKIVRIGRQVADAMQNQRPDLADTIRAAVEKHQRDMLRLLEPKSVRDLYQLSSR